MGIPFQGESIKDKWILPHNIQLQIHSVKEYNQLKFIIMSNLNLKADEEKQASNEQRLKDVVEQRNNFYNNISPESYENFKLFNQGKTIYHLVWGFCGNTEKVFWFDTTNKTLHKQQLKITIPNLCRTAATNDGRLFCFGGDNNES